MKGVKRPLGYTIVEVMIVLAVSGVMFLIATVFISGKEAKTAFTEGSNQFASQLQTIIAQVVNGQYSDVQFGCSANGSPSNPITFPASGSQGTNSDCIFLGKYLYFPEGNAASYQVFSLASLREPSLFSLTVAPVKPVYNPGSGVDLTLQQAIPQSLSITSVKVISGATSVTNTYGIGFVQSLGPANPSAPVVTGSQTVSMVYAPALHLGGQTESNAANDLTSSSAIVNSLKPADSAVICLTDGTRYAAIELGDTNNADQLSVNVQVVPTC